MRKSARSKCEKNYEYLLRTYLIAKNWFVRKLHGNVYQIGLPDLLVGRKKDGKLMLIEVKIIQEANKYFVKDLLNLLEGPQAGTIVMLAKLNAAIWIVAGCGKRYLWTHAPFRLEERVYTGDIEELYEALNNG